jgi:Ni,Fe-hydrogenase I large subunit
MSEVVENTVDQTVVTDSSGEPQRELLPEEQEAIEKYRESQKPKEERESGMPDGYNEDGTQQEELIAGKFKSQEDLLAAYQELEKKLGQPKEETPQEEPKEETQAEPEDTGSFSTVQYEKEFMENGSLSDESYTDLEKKGFTREQVDAYIKGQQAYAGSIQNTIYSSVGGQEAYTDIINWAGSNLPEDVIKDYNSAVESLDQDRILRTLEYMKMKKDTESPRETRRLEGNAPVQGVQPYGNKNEWQRDATNRLYGKDAKFTNMVDQRYLAARKRGLL